MKITAPAADVLQAATDGDLAALDAVLLAVQPGIYNLAVRMLGNRDDAADATQEILLKVVTHLSTFESKAAFTTWVFSIARNHLLTTLAKRNASPEVSLEAIGDKLRQGLAYGESHSGWAEQLAAQQMTAGQPRMQTPEEKLDARQVALGCTQNMLMALDAEQRLAYLLDTVFGLSGQEAADVLQVEPSAYRQRLSRARAKLDGFVGTTCGLVNRDAACQCAKQIPALNFMQTHHGVPRKILALHRAEQDEALRKFDDVVMMADAAALFRAHPNYQAPGAQRDAIRAVLRAGGYLPGGQRLQ